MYRRAYILTFDRDDNRNYKAIHDKIVNLPSVITWWHYIKSSYIIIASTNSATELNNEILKITTEDLKQKYNPEKMTELEVYPTIWDEGDDAFEYLAEGFSTIQYIFAEATKKGEAIITFLN